MMALVEYRHAAAAPEQMQMRGFRVRAGSCKGESPEWQFSCSSTATRLAGKTYMHFVSSGALNLNSTNHGTQPERAIVRGADVSPTSPRTFCRHTCLIFVNVQTPSILTQSACLLYLWVSLVFLSGQISRQVFAEFTALHQFFVTYT